MKKEVFFSLLMIILGLGNVSSQMVTDGIEDAKVLQKETLSFTENKGQISDQDYNPRPDVLFSGSAGGLDFHIREDGISYQMTRIDSWKEEDEGMPEDLPEELREERDSLPDEMTIYRTDINWIGAQTNYEIEKGTPTDGFNNYYLPSCPDGALNVLSYQEVTFKNLYQGIDVKWYENAGTLEYDFIVAPNTDYTKISWEIKGAEKISIGEDGQLIIKTPLGEIEEQAPIAFQGETQVEAAWKIDGNKISFQLGNYNENEVLIIDPVVRLWGTYYGGTGADYGESCATDASGNVYLAGYTSSTTGIATSGSHQSTGAGTDSYLVKFNSSGVRQWGTYYGGRGYSCATDNTGNVFLAGRTSTTSGIATSGSHQTAYGGGSYDAFLVKFNSSGVRQWGTYYGGSSSEWGYSCATDTSGNVYLSGHTNSTTGIATSGAFIVTNTNGNSLSFLAKFNSSGLRQWGTYHNGESPSAHSCATDNTGNVFLAGYTTYTSGIATSGSHQPTSGGYTDAFLVKFNSSGVRQWGTYYGGTGGEEGFSCATDNTGNVFLAGHTGSTTGISTTGSHQPTSGGYADAFLVKFNSSGVRQWGTYYGGSSGDIGYSCATDNTGNVFLAGHTYTTSGIATSGSHQTAYGGDNDGFLVKFNSSGVRQWGTYYGGSYREFGYSCATDNTGNVFLAGYTTSTSGIATTGAHKTSKTGESAFLARFSDCITLSVSMDTMDVNCFGDSTGQSLATVSGGAPPYSFIWSTGSTSATAATLSVGTYAVTAIDTNGCIGIGTVTITQPTQLYASATQSNSVACFGGSNGSATASATGGTGTKTFVWSTGSTSATATGLSAGTYSVTATDANSCTATTNVTITQPTQLMISATITAVSCYDGSDGIVTAPIIGGTGTKTRIWSTGATSASITGLSAGIYSVTATDANGCTATTTANVTQRPLLEVSITVPTPVTCKGGSNSTATASSAGGTGSKSYLWSNTETTNSATTLSAGSQSVTVTDANGCTATETVEVVEPDSALTSSITQSKDNVCPGDSTASIEVIANGGWLLYDYLWSDSSQGTSISSLGDSTYWVRVTDSLGCETSDTFTIVRLYENPTVDLGPDSVICDRTVINIDAGNLGSTYLWSTGDSTQVINNYDLQPGITMAYMVLVTDVNGCKGSDTVYISVSHCLGMDEPIEGELQLYPNPTRDRVTLAYPGGYEYRMHDSKGKLLKEGRAHDTTTIEMQGLASGNYTITITTNAGQSLTRQVIVQ